MVAHVRALWPVPPLAHIHYPQLAALVGKAPVVRLLRQRQGSLMHRDSSRINKTVTRWGLLDDTTTQLDGRCVHLIFENCLPVIFRTRREARAYAEKKFGYIRARPDLLREPHNCRVPRAVRITVSAA